MKLFTKFQSIFLVLLLSFSICNAKDTTVITGQVTEISEDKISIIVSNIKITVDPELVEYVGLSTGELVEIIAYKSGDSLICKKIRFLEE